MFNIKTLIKLHDNINLCAAVCREQIHAGRSEQVLEADHSWGGGFLWQVVGGRRGGSDLGMEQVRVL